MSDLDNTQSGSEELGYDTDTDVTDDVQDEWTPPTREEYEKLVADKRKATTEAVKRKNLLRENGIDLSTGKRAGVETDEDDGDKISKADFETAVKQAAANASKRERHLALELNASLAEAGWNGSGSISKIHRLLDLDSVIVDEEGVSGLEEQIAELKRDFPMFFKRTRSSEPSAEAAGMSKKQSEPVKKDWADALSEQLFGQI